MSLRAANGEDWAAKQPRSYAYDGVVRRSSMTLIF